MPFNKIMDLLQLSLLIFSLISCRVLGETPWRHNQARYNGYDLRRGPVFYEVYYANENWPSPRDQWHVPNSPTPESQYANDGRILEKTYQAASDSYYNAAGEASFEPEEKTVVDRRYAQRKRPMNILPYGRDMLAGPREYTGGETTDERYQATVQLGNFVEGNEGKYPPTGLLQDIDSSANFMESKAGRTYDSVSSYASRKFEDDYIRPLLSAIESSAREILEKQIRRESLAQTGNNAKTSRSPRFAGSENPVDQADLGMRVVLARHPDTPSRSENFDSAASSSESGYWRNANQRINDLSMDQGRLRKQHDQRGSISRVPFVPKEKAFEPGTQAGNRVISEILAPAKASHEQPRQSQPSNPNYQPPRSYSQNLIEEAEKEMEKESEKTPIVESIEVSEVTRHKVRHHHGEKPRHKHRRRRGEAGH